MPPDDRGLPKISVLIPSFNQARFLVKTLATVVKQDYPAAEVVIADGGSADGTRAVVEAYGTSVTHFVSELDRGQLDGFGKALARATGDVCYWLNADDAVMPGTFAYVARLFAADPALDLVFSDNYAFDEAARRLYVGGTIRGMDFWDHFLFYRQLYSECAFWRRAAAGAALPLDVGLRVYTDYSFFLPLRYGRRCRWVPRRLGAFRVQPGQNSQVYRARGDAERELVKQRMRERLGISVDEFRRRQRRRRASFALRQVLYPRLHSGARYLLRTLSRDTLRRRTAAFFFDQWLRPPADVAARLGPHAFDAGADARVL